MDSNDGLSFSTCLTKCEKVDNQIKKNNESKYYLKFTMSPVPMLHHSY